MDFVVAGLLIVVYLITKSRQTKITALAFIATVVFSYSFMFDLLSAFYIHIIYGVIITIFIPYASIRNGAGLLLYAMFNHLIAADYLFYPNGGTYIEIYYDMLHNVIDLCLIYLSVEWGENVDRDSDINSHNYLFNKSIYSCTYKVEATER